MAITVRIPPPLRKFTNGAEIAEVTAKNLSEMFEGLDREFPGIRKALCAEDGTPLRFVNIYVNDEDIRFLGGPGYVFQDGDEVLLIPAIAGGAWTRPSLRSSC
jgi:sulfur-carrier protein